MFLPDVSIRRPVLAWVLTFVILIFGLVGYQRLAVRDMPDIDYPIVTVTVTWRGAAPDVLEREVTDLIEEEINTIEGIRTISSQTREERSQIVVEFQLERSIDVATQDVRDAVSRARRRLPQDIDEPSIQKQDADARPILWVGLSSDWMSRVEVADFAERQVKERLEILPGVGRVNLGGARRFAVRIDIDAEKLAARELTVTDVAHALRRENIELPSGRIESDLREFVVRTRGRLESPDAFNDIVIATRNGTPIRIRDVGEARRGTDTDRHQARFTGKTAIGIGVVRQSQANTLDVANRVKEEVEAIRRDLPPGVYLEPAFDSSLFIQESVDSTMSTLILAGLMVVVVMFVFLRSLRSSFIPAVVIPVAVIGTFAIMYAAGFSVNVITLLGLILAIGLLVDDAIVMLENIYRHMEQQHERPIDAARRGAAEIAFAVIASSLSLVAVFVPVAFVTGIVGKFFYEFGLTVASAIFISTLIALTLTPMLCSRILRVKKEHNAVYYALEHGFDALGNAYGRTLALALRHRPLVMTLAVAVFALGVAAYQWTTREFAPQQDQGSFMSIARAPEGATLEYTDRYMQEAERVLTETPEVRNYMAVIGFGGGQTHRAMMFITLIDRRERTRSQAQIMSELRGRFAQIPGIMVFLQERSPVGGAGQNTKPVQYVIQHPDMAVLSDGSDELVRRLRETPGFVDVDSDLELNKPELQIRIDRDKAADLGVSVRDIAEALQIMLGGLDVTEYTERGKQYDVIVQLREGDRARPRDLESIYVRTRGGRLVPITNLVSFEEQVGPSQINHYNRSRSVTVSANLDGITLGDALKTVEEQASEILPADTTFALAGEARDMAESFQSLMFTFYLAILIVYLVLAAQFNSWIHPFTILLGLPLALVGAFGALWLFDATMNIFSFIGLIMLAGLVTKNGILLIDYTNRKRDEGMERMDAILMAGKVRLRPILMTAVTTIIGVLPIAMGLGAGGEARAPLGIVVIGGLTLSTLLTLVVIPVFYTLLDDGIQKLKRIKGGDHAEVVS